MEIVTAGNFVSEVVRSEIPVLVDFWAEWCGPCRMVAPVLEELSVELEGKLKIVKINSDEEVALAQRHDIRSIPTLIVYKGGEEVYRMMGAKPKPALLKELKSFISL